MKTFLYSLCLVCAFAVSCKEKSVPGIDESNCEIIQVKGKNLKNDWKYSELFDKVSYIPLETRDECLIGGIDKLKYLGDRFYISDRKTKSVFVFDAQGKFLWKIHSPGRGPQEYNRIIDLDVNEKNKQLYLYANYPQKIMLYDSCGKFISELPVGINANSIAIQDDRLILHAANLANHIEGQMQNPQILIFSLAENSLTNYELPLNLKNNDYACLIYQYGEAFQHLDKELLCFMPLDNKIYSIRNNKISSKYKIDFGKYKLPEPIDHSELRFSELAFGLNTYWENDNYCYFQCNMNHCPYNFLYYKKNKELYYGYLNDNLGNFHPHIITADNESMLAYRNASELFMSAEYLQKEKGITDRPVSELVRQMNESDNPVIFFYKFKKGV